MPARHATIEDLKKSYSTYCFESYEDEQTKTTTICKGCDEKISLYNSHICRKFLEKYSDRTDSGWWNVNGKYIPRDRSKFHQFGYSWHDCLTNSIIQPAINAMNKIPVHIKQEPTDHDYVSQIQKLMNDGWKFENLTKKIGLDIIKEKINYICPMCREKEDICDCKGFNDRKYMEEKVTSRVVEAMEKDKFVDGKTTYSGTLDECSTDIAAIKQLAGIDWGKENSQSNNWEIHPIYLELENNTDVKCEVDNKGKITGTVVSNRYLSKQWFLDFEKRCCLNDGVQSMSSWQDSNFQGLLNFQIQLVEYMKKTKRVPRPIYEVGLAKPFYLDCAICNQCDQEDIYKPKTENYTCQKCWPR